MSEISVNALTISFGGVYAVRDVTFDIASGEFVTLLGPSGCGKTTLLKLISGFLKPNSGSILLGGRDVSKVPPEQRDSAMCFQSYALFPHLSVRDNLEFGLRQKRVAPAERARRLDAVLAHLELGPHFAKLPNQLSGGQQQRVALGRALVMRPGVILFDEPLSNLDAKLRDQVRIEIRRIQQDFGLTAIYVTHDQSEALAISDRVFLMNAGRIEQAAAPERLYHQPATSFVAEFIGGANLLDAELIGRPGADSWEFLTGLGRIVARSAEPPCADRLRLCWRPEHATLSTDGAGGPNVIDGLVVNRAFQGHFTELLLEKNSIAYRIQLGQSSAQRGEPISISIAPHHVRLLEALT